MIPDFRELEESPGSAAQEKAERRLRKQLFDSAAKLTPIVAARGEGTYLVSTFDRGLGRSLFIRGSRGEFATLGRAIAACEAAGLEVRGKCFVDIGANVGTSTIPALSGFGMTKALATEPFPQTLRLLKANLALNELGDRATVFNYAAGDHVGSVSLALSSDNWGDHRVVIDGHETPIGPSYLAVSGRRRLTVPCSTLDRMLEEARWRSEDVGLIWVDVQGYEGKVLAGAAEAIAAGVPIVIELWAELLAANGGLNVIRGVIESTGRQVVDLRQGRNGNPAVLDLAGFDELAEDYGNRGAITELLLLPRGSSPR